MKKRVTALALALVLILALASPALAAEGLGNFTYSKPYTNGMFSDVNENAWYGAQQQAVIKYAVRLGIMDGKDTGFDPTGSIRICEAIKMAAVAHDIYIGEMGWFPEATPWYQPHVDYALEYGIIYPGEFSDYTAYATRAQMAAIFARALPEEAFPALRTVSALPDVYIDKGYGPEIFLLYRSGVLSGDDSSGTFRPNDRIMRAEAAAIITRECVASRRDSGAITAPALTVTDYCSLSGYSKDGYRTRYSYRLPKISGSANAEWVNTEIAAMYNNTVLPQLDEINRGYSLIYANIDYSYRLSGGVLSLVVKTLYDANDFVTFKTFLLDENGSQLTGPQLLARRGVSESTFLARARSAISSWASADFTTSDPSVYNESVSSSNYGTGMPMYITEDGTIGIVVKIYCLAGAGYYWQCLDTGL